jgi:hypothetical protein
MLSTCDRLDELDQHVQREARFAATSKRTARSRTLVPYRILLDAGHLPLVAAFWAMHRDTTAYDALVFRRTGLGSPPGSSSIGEIPRHGQRQVADRGAVQAGDL